jgi:hypothetical protein
MKSTFAGLILSTVAAFALGATAQCETGFLCKPQAASPSGHPYIPQQRIQPVARNVQVTVPVPQPPRPYGRPAYLPSPMYCPPAAPATAPSPPVPVRVDIAVRPEGCDRRHLVPVVYRDPGFLGPIVCYSVGLVGATIAAPFRVAEMLCPLDAPACRPKQRCGPSTRPLGCGYPPRVSPPVTPKCPVPLAQPAPPCCPVLACAPTGPSVAPLPPCGPPPSCGPNLPPALVEEYQFPQFEPQNVLSGIWNLPGSLIRTGRFAGDLGKTSASARTSGW